MLSPMLSILDSITDVYDVELAPLVTKRTKIQATLFAPALFMGLPSTSIWAEEEDATLEQVHVVGTRNAGRSSGDLAVPVDIIDKALLEATGEIEFGRMLQRVAPSFGFSSSSISDGTDALRPATLRGLGPDQTLVLLNSKRRHNSALLHINTSVGRGTAGVDMNAIPTSAIKRVEILRDGASAQYGSDAIAGVINIVLEDDAPSTIEVKTGGYSEGDGHTYNIALSNGFELDNGNLFASLNYRNRDQTNRAGLTGVCQYQLTCSNQGANYITDDPREIAFDRRNFSIGDSASEQLQLVLNAGMETFDGEYYGFLTYSWRENESAGFFRRANEISKNPILSDAEAFYPDGFLPKIATDIEDFSASFGYSKLMGESTTWDLSLTFGSNSMQYGVNNSVNASFVSNNITTDASQLRNQTQTSADAGKLRLSLATINLDYVSEFERTTLAYGFEYRYDSYGIDAGEPYSYLDYDGVSSGAIGGIQVFPGFAPVNEVSENRSVWSGYLDAEFDVNSQLLITSAVRGDHYQSFGNSINLKLSGRYDLSKKMSVRGSVSSGFRAPSMQQIYFNNVSTQFNNGVAAQVGTFRNNSQLASELGIPGLQEESSVNLSAGLSYATNSSSLTLDFYHISIADRIVISEQLTPDLGIESVSNSLISNGVQGAQFFINGADTETRGIDLVFTHKPSAVPNLELTLAGNVTKTEVEGLSSPETLKQLAPEHLFGEQAISIIESWQPKSRALASATYRWQGLELNLNINYFGSYRVIDANEAQDYSPKWLTDIGINWQVNDDMKLTAGINNLFDIKPDRNLIGQSRAGTIVTSQGDTIVESDGVFQYSRRAAPFGFNGSFWYLGVEYAVF